MIENWNELMATTLLLWAVVEEGKEIAFTPEGISYVMLIVGSFN